VEARTLHQRMVVVWMSGIRRTTMTAAGRKGIDSGEGFAEHLLGPVDPYNRNNHYTPHSRFATRPQMRWVKAEDPIENLPAGPARTPGAGRQRNHRRPGRKPTAPPRHEDVSNPVLTPADVERVQQAFGASFSSQRRPASRKRSKAADAAASRPETCGERLARRKGHAEVKGITLKQAKALPDLRRSASRQSKKAQAAPAPDPRKKSKKGRSKQPAAKQDHSSSAQGARKEQRRRQREAELAWVRIERSMRWAGQDRAIRDRQVAETPTREPWHGPVSLRPLASDAGSVPKGVCASCSGPISVTGQCACS
jgi:hypothetical protein